MYDTWMDYMIINGEVLKNRYIEPNNSSIENKVVDGSVNHSIEDEMKLNNHYWDKNPINVVVTAKVECPKTLVKKKDK
ncbi:MAG: hypothetical protein Q4E69_00905 [Bacilli bacterium]|nr:hypothetical protein [Bacilli bacterium]